MAKLGEFTKTENGFTGQVATIDRKFAAVLERIEKAEGEKGPDFRIKAVNGAEIGVASLRTGQSSGKAYVRVSIDAPELKAPIHANLVEQADGKWGLIWQRERGRTQARDQGAERSA